MIQVQGIISENLQFPLIKQIKQLNYNIDDTYLFLYLIWQTLSGKESVDVGRALKGIYDNPSKRIRYMQDILLGNNTLISDDLIETIDAQFFNDTHMKLTDKSFDMLKSCDIDLFHKKVEADNIISPDDTAYRKLIFNESDMKQLFLLKNLLSNDKFTETQKRLTEKGMPKGVNVLLHGVPGTGKTESVLQMAKETNRKIMKVDISQSKSKWFGESEKVIKQIFINYKTFAKECESTPILLFNEADAIMSKRMDIGDSNVAQTQNAMQNIILEELENFNGILIATTNLTKNIDAAFERRFLFKIEFNNPDTTIKTKIWKLKLPTLSVAECNKLATKFNFSGGHIDNIVRKKEIHEIVHGEKANYSLILSFCNEESIVNNKVSIGFNN